MKEDLIPNGSYCYLGKYICPFWHRWENSAVYCSYLNIVDFSNVDEDTFLTTYEQQHREENYYLLWDQCKECGVNDE